MNQKTIREILGKAPKWAEEMVLNFGKHKGEMLGEVMVIDRGYLCWLEHQPFLNAEMKKAINLILGSE